MLVKTNLLRVEHGATEKEVGGGGYRTCKTQWYYPEKSFKKEGEVNGRLQSPLSRKEGL